jgi:DNA-binding response OmpR family regulator
VHARRILVADGHASHLQFIRQSLERDRHRVTTAHCGKEAIEYLSLHEFDAVLLDLHMSDIDGETVFKLYRFGKLHAAPTYILTADTSAATAARLKECGAQGVLHKPVAGEDLRSTIATLFR